MTIDLSKIQDTDLFAATAPDGVTYKVTGAQFKTLFVVEDALFIDSIGQTDSDWSPYLRILTYPDKNAPDESKFYYWSEQDRNSINCFTNNGRNFVWASYENTFAEFKPPTQIQVYSEITILAGFHEKSRTGVMSINGVDIIELEAWDRFPQEFTIPFNGTMDNFSIRQKFPAAEPGGSAWSGNISSISFDGKRLLNQSATKLFLRGSLFDEVYIGTRITQRAPVEVTGVVSVINETEKSVVLDDLYPDFVSGSQVYLEA